MHVQKPARGTSAAVAPLPPTPVEEAERRFSVVVGTFLSHDMALAEKDHLARLTAYRVWVSSARVQGVKTYRLMVGRFDSTEAAESAAQTLMRRGLIRDASVQPLSADATD
ncbi:MAG: SPOR domain-containing protein [Deltaproteobacteria bacterium]|nr:MAG: SPOR domain-containing protein [Deltaproteobacteria bacterium]